MERTAGTFQDRLVTELRLAGASSIGEANGVLEQFLPRYNRRFRVTPQCPESAYRTLGPELSLEQVLCFKHRRKVAKDNTVKFQLHMLQLLPEPERPAMLAPWWKFWKDWTAGSVCATRDASSTPRRLGASPVFLRNGQRGTASGRASPAGSDRLDQRWAAALKPLDSRASDEEDEAGLSGGEAGAPTPATVPPRKPTFLQREMEGNSEGQAQGDVAAGGPEGIGNPQSHHQEIHGCRRSSGAEVPAGPHCVKI